VDSVVYFARIEGIARDAVEFGKLSLKILDDVVLANKAYLDLILSDTFAHKTYYMGLVDENNRVNFYDGTLRVVDPEGKEFLKFAPSEYLEHIGEHVEPWTYLKFPFLKQKGWQGFTDGADSGLYRATPLARLNALPYATLCIRCQREAEREAGSSRADVDWGRLLDVSSQDVDLSINDIELDVS